MSEIMFWIIFSVYRSENMVYTFVVVVNVYYRIEKNKELLFCFMIIY